MSSTQKTRNRWIILIGCILGTGTTGGAYIWNVFKPRLMEQFGWSATSTTLIYSCMILMIFLTGLVVGKISDQRSPKKLAICGAVLYALGWILAGFVSSLPLMFLCISVIVGIGNGMLYTNCISVANKWFPDKKGMATGLVVAGCNLTSLICSPISNYFGENFGASRSLTLMGLVFAGMYVIGMLCIKDNPPEGWKPEGWNPEAGRSEFISRKEFTRKEMLGTSMFWIMLCVFIMAQCSGQLIVSSASSIGQAMIGLTAAAGALMSSCNSFGNVIGRIGWGTVSDKIGRFNSLYLILGLSIVVMLVTPQVTSMGIFVVCMVVNGICFAGIMSIFPPMVGDRFGVKNQSQNFSCMYAGTATASFIGPLLGSLCYDIRGDYSMAFVGSAVLSAVAILLTILMSRMMKKEAVEK